MKIRNPVIITILTIIIITSLSITDNNLPETIQKIISDITATLYIPKKDSESKIPIDPEVLAIPFCNTPENIIRYSGYSLLYSEKHEQAAWVAYVLTYKEVKGKISRSNNFRKDPSIITGSAQLEDYRGSGYDRGHLAPAGDLKWSRSSMNDSFFLSNISPQAPGFNRDIWRRLEEWVRNEAIANNALIVITGPVLTDGPYKKIGIDRVDVPKRFFKVLLDFKEPEIKAVGFIMENKASAKPVTDFAVSVDTVEEITGLDFFYLLPDPFEENLEAKYSTDLWK